MAKKLLVAYGTAAGSTAEVAQAIGEEMEKAGAVVDVKPVEEVEDLKGYDAVVVGTAVRAFRILSKTQALHAEAQTSAQPGASSLFPGLPDDG